MRTIGLIGGMSWLSTAQYYRIFNEAVRDRLGSDRSARCVIASLDFGEIIAARRIGDSEAVIAQLVGAAQALESAGAHMVLIATNTMHQYADYIMAAVSIPLLHIADVVGAEIRFSGHSRVGLVGTRATMALPFYRDRLNRHFGLDVIVPDLHQQAEIDRIIHEELCVGRIESRSRQMFRDILSELVDRGAQAVILGCTEIMLLIANEDCSVPLFDTTELHAHAAVEHALEQ